MLVRSAGPKWGSNRRSHLSDLFDVCACVCACARMCACALVRTAACVREFLYVRACARACMPACLRACMPACLRACARARVCGVCVCVCVGSHIEGTKQMEIHQKLPCKVALNVHVWGTHFRLKNRKEKTNIKSLGGEKGSGTSDIC